MYNELLDQWAKQEELADALGKVLHPANESLARLRVLNAALLGLIHRLGSGDSEQ